MSIKKQLKKIKKKVDDLKRPSLVFHHEDIHIRLDEIEHRMNRIESLLIKVLANLDH